MDHKYGRLLYEYSDAKHPLDMSKRERRQHIKSFDGICPLICTLLLTAWCIVNFILDLKIYTTASVIKKYVILFIILGVVLLITILSVFGLWGIFMRMVTKTYRPRDLEARQRIEELREDLQTCDNNKNCENALTIFEECIIIKRNGEERIIDKKDLTICHMIKSRTGVFLDFYIGQTEQIAMNCLLPIADSYLIKKHLADKLEIVHVKKSKASKSADRLDEKDNCRVEKGSAPKRDKEKFDCAKIETGAIIAGSITIAVGIAIVLLGHFHVMGDMPAIAGGFPIGVGLMFVVLAFSRYEFASAFLIKFFAAALLIFMGLSFLFIIENAITKSSVTVSSLLRHPTDYGLICLYFVSIGISIIPNAIKSLIEYIKYR